jgi:hypothetical protein
LINQYEHEESAETPRDAILALEFYQKATEGGFDPAGNYQSGTQIISFSCLFFSSVSSICVYSGHDEFAEGRLVATAFTSWGSYFSV